MDTGIIVTHYRGSFAKIARMRGFVFAAVGLFALGAVLGALLPQESLARLRSFEELAARVRELDLATLIALIFLKNASAAFITIVLGVVGGLVPAFAAVSNGMLLGAVWLVRPYALWRVIPHGMFELPAVFLAWAIGLRFGAWLLEDRRLESLKTLARDAVTLYVSVILPLLVIAAVIEGSAVALLR